MVSGYCLRIYVYREQKNIVNLNMSPVRPSFDCVPGRIFYLATLQVILILCILSGQGDAAGLADSKKAGVYDVTIRIDRNPPILGVNNLEVEIREAGGASIADAKVLVNYYMPPMPRMAPMNYRVDAPFKGGKYRVAMNFIMEGPWVIVVKINHQGKAASAKFNVNVP